MATATAAPAEKNKKKDGKSKKKLIIIAVLALVVLGAAYKFVLAKPASTAAAKPVGGDIVTLDPNTLNLTDGHYLKVAVAIQLVKGQAAATTFETSEAQQLVLDEFSNRSITSLQSNATRQKLTDELTASLKKAYTGEIYKVFLTQFVTQ